MHRKLFLAIAAAAVMAFATISPASAYTTQRYSVRISYADLNIHTEAGADALLTRIRDYARTTCVGNATFLTLEQRRDLPACMSNFERRALVALDDDYVATRFANRDAPTRLASR